MEHCISNRCVNFVFYCHLLDCCKGNAKCGRKLKHKLIGVLADVYGLLSSADEPWVAFHYAKPTGQR